MHSVLSAYFCHSVYFIQYIYMVPLKQIYIDSRRSTKDSKSSSDFRIYFLVNITLPPYSAFYITDSIIRASWYTVEVGRTASMYLRINGPAYSASKCTSLKETLAPIRFALLSVM